MAKLIISLAFATALTFPTATWAQQATLEQKMNKTKPDFDNPATIEAQSQIVEQAKKEITILLNKNQTTEAAKLLLRVYEYDQTHVVIAANLELINKHRTALDREMNNLLTQKKSTAAQLRAWRASTEIVRAEKYRGNDRKD